jgi:hypothetical protein
MKPYEEIPNFNVANMDLIELIALRKYLSETQCSTCRVAVIDYRIRQLTNKPKDYSHN